MNLLLDTHTLLWYVTGDAQLSRTAESLIVDPAHDVWIPEHLPRHGGAPPHGPNRLTPHG